MALACSWGGFVDTDLNFSEFFNSDHTIAVWFMLQYPHAYTGPILSVNGTGTYLVGQGDFLSDSPGNQVKLVMQIGAGQVNYPVNLLAGTWHHLAVVRKGTTFKMYLDGEQVGAPLTLSASNQPAGTLRIGKNSFDPALDAGGAQFYGLIDDLAIFKKALSRSRIRQHMNALYLSGQEPHLYAGYLFGDVLPDGLPPKLARPLALSPAASIHEVSTNRDSAADAQQFPLSLTSHMHLPFPIDEAWEVIQGFDKSGPDDSHKGYAAFCWDFILAGKPPSDSKNKPFVAAAPGQVDFVKQDATSGGSINYISIKQADHEFCDYLHLVHNSAKVDVGDQVGFDQRLANVGDTGAKIGAYHLHLAVTNLGEANSSKGGAFVTIPAPFSNYEASDDRGKTWYRVLRGIPREGQWVRRKATTSPVRYTAVWQPSSEGEIQVYGWTYKDYRAKYDELWPLGWRLKLLTPYVINDQVRYTAVWRPSSEGEIQVYGWTYKDYRAKYDELWPQGWRLKLLTPYVVNDQVRYTAVWRPSSEGEIQVYGWTYKDYRAKYDELWPQGWRLKLLSPYVLNDQLRYTAVWQPGTAGEIQVYGWSYEDYRARYDVLWQLGWRLKLLSPYLV